MKIPFFNHQAVVTIQLSNKQMKKFNQLPQVQVFVFDDNQDLKLETVPLKIAGNLIVVQTDLKNGFITIK